MTDEMSCLRSSGVDPRTPGTCPIATKARPLDFGGDRRVLSLLRASPSWIGADSERVMREMQAFAQQVNAAIVDPAFIVKVRKKLALDQREAAEIFGGGVNAFSRYENGKTKPPLALVKLLKVLDRHPDLLDEVKVA